MRHNDTVRFGATLSFRFNHPAEAAWRAKKTGKRSLPTPGRKKALPKPPGSSKPRNRTGRKIPQPPPASLARASQRTTSHPHKDPPSQAALMPVAREEAPATATTGVTASQLRQSPRDLEDAAVAVVVVPAAATPLPAPAYVVEPATDHLDAMAALRQQQVSSQLHSLAVTLRQPHIAGVKTGLRGARPNSILDGAMTWHCFSVLCRLCVRS